MFVEAYLWRHTCGGIFVEEDSKKTKKIYLLSRRHSKDCEATTWGVIQCLPLFFSTESPFSDKLNFILVQSWSLYFCDPLSVKADNTLTFSSLRLVIPTLSFNHIYTEIHSVAQPGVRSS